MLFSRQIPTNAPIHLLCRSRRLPSLCRPLSTVPNTSICKPFYITTPIFYPNAGISPRFLHHVSSLLMCPVPHIGHLYSLVVADIFARFAHISEPNRSVHFLTGTDEHGLKIQKAAKDRGMEPSLLCNDLSERFRVCRGAFLLTTYLTQCVTETWQSCQYQQYSIFAHN